MRFGPVDTSPAASLALPDGAPVHGASLISARGRVRLPETRAIERRALEAALAGCRSIVLDLTNVTELGAGLLGGILRMRRGLGAIGGRLVLVVDGPPVDALVKVSVIEALVDVVPTLEDAAALLAPTARGSGVRAHPVLSTPAVLGPAEVRRGTPGVVGRGARAAGRAAGARSGAAASRAVVT